MAQHGTVALNVSSVRHCGGAKGASHVREERRKAIKLGKLETLAIDHGARAMRGWDGMAESSPNEK